jgi:two-component system chemotaxis response regulator CheB
VSPVSSDPATHVVVIGASAGGVGALSTLVRALPADMDAAVFIVLHIPPHTPSNLAIVLGRDSAMPVATARDGDPIVPGEIRVAATDRHLVVDPHVMRLTYGPREGRARPSVDVLFRSAAAAYGPRAIGLILTGLLDDGTAGLWAIKDRGGRALVQDPATAQFPSMPESAIRHVAVDAVLPLDGLADAILAMTKRPLPIPSQGVPDWMRIENLIAREGNGLKAGVMGLGAISPYTCPDCHGVLIQIEQGSIQRFRCHTGHSYSLQTLLAETNRAIQSQLWDTVRTIEERILLMRQLAHLAPDAETARHYLAEADKTEVRLKPLHTAALDAELIGDPAVGRSTEEAGPGR